MKHRILIASLLGFALTCTVILGVAAGGPQPEMIPLNPAYDTAEMAATTHITFVHSLYGPHLVTLSKEYETTHPDVEIYLVYTNSNRILDLMSQRADNIDIFSIDVIWPAEATHNNWILPLDDYVAQSSIITPSDFLSGPIEAMTVNDHLMAIPWFVDAGLLYYRTDLLATQGYTYPRTFEELGNQAQTIMSSEGITNGFVWQGNEYEGLTCDFLEYVWGSGGEIFEEPCDVVLSSTESISGLQTMVDYINEGTSPVTVTSYMEEDARNTFQSGDAVFMRNWPYAWSLLQRNDSPVKGNVGIAPMPHAPGQESAATLGGWNLAINSASVNPDAAFEFIEFLTAYEQQKYLALNLSHNPSRIAVYSEAEVCGTNPFTCDLYDVFVHARPRPPIVNYTDFSTALQEEVHDALLGNQTSAEAITNAQMRLQLIAGCRAYMPITLKED
jgi:multiple sugar transport system substrate-binding protein